MDTPEQAPAQMRSTIAELIRHRLEAVRESISRELCTIPTPIPGCDVNFNRLLEDRSKVVDELQRLARLTAQPASDAAFVDFAQASEWLDQSTRERIAERCSAAGSSR